jgi:hypothetical protein
MLNFKTFLIAIAITFLALAGFINSSDAFEIETMESDDGSYEDYNYGDAQGIWHMAYVRTSEPYYTVEWFIDDVYQGSSYGDSNNPKVEAFFWPYWLSGTLGGTKYTIKAVAYPMEGDPTSTADSYTLTVYRPEIDSGTKLGVYGYVEITQCGWSGWTSSSSHYASIHNTSDSNIRATFKFEYSVVHLWANGNWKNDLYTRLPQVKVVWKLEPGEPDSDSFSDSYTLPGGNDWGQPREKARVETRNTLEVWNHDTEESDEWVVTGSDDVNISEL